MKAGKNNVKELFYPMLPDVRNSTGLPESCQVIPACHSNKIAIMTKMIMKHRRSYSDMEQTKFLRQKHILVPLFPPQTSHGPAWNRKRTSTLRGR